MFLDLPVKFPTLLSDFNQIWSSSTNFRGSPEYQISWKSIQAQERWCMKTGWRIWQSLALFVTLRTRLRRAKVLKLTVIKQAFPRKRRRLATLFVHTVKGLMRLRSWTSDLTQSGVDERGKKKQTLKNMARELQHQVTHDRNWCLACRSQFQDRLHSVIPIFDVFYPTNLRRSTNRIRQKLLELWYWNGGCAQP